MLAKVNLHPSSVKDILESSRLRDRSLVKTIQGLRDRIQNQDEKIHQLEVNNTGLLSEGLAPQVQGNFSLSINDQERIVGEVLASLNLGNMLCKLISPAGDNMLIGKRWKHSWRTSL